MAKVTVKATEDFFDRANQVRRVKGSEFQLKEDYAKSLGKSVSGVEKKEAVKTPKQERIATKQAQNKEVAASAKPSGRRGIEIVEKVNKRK